MKRSIIVRNWDKRENENVRDRVNDFIYNGLKPDRVTVESATRKPTRSDSRAGIVVAVFKSMKDKENIMKRKIDLKMSRHYEKVYVEHNLPPKQRRLNNNLRAIVNTIGSDRLRLKGSRILQTDTDRRGHTGTYSCQRTSRSYAETQRNRSDHEQYRGRNYDRDYKEKGDF